jgi:hypothetical protein
MSVAVLNRIAELERIVSKLGERLAALEEEHSSSCATNNAPALPVGPCDCKDRKRARSR